MTRVLLPELGPISLCNQENEASTMPYSRDVLFIFSGVFSWTSLPPDEDDP